MFLGSKYRQPQGVWKPRVWKTNGIHVSLHLPSTSTIHGGWYTIHGSVMGYISTPELPDFSRSLDPMLREEVLLSAPEDGACTDLWMVDFLGKLGGKYTSPHGSKGVGIWQFCWWPFWDGKVKWPFLRIVRDLQLKNRMVTNWITWYKVRPPTPVINRFTTPVNGLGTV